MIDVLMKMAVDMRFHSACCWDEDLTKHWNKCEDHTLPPFCIMPVSIMNAGFIATLFYVGFVREVEE